ncbi:hypothetical protein ACFL5V_09685 [Fibrobacterota bacterium]
MLNKKIFLVLILMNPLSLLPQEADSLVMSRKMSLCINPLGPLGGGYGGNMEFLISPHNAVLAEGAFFSGWSAFEFMGETRGHAAGIHYRYHWQPGLPTSFSGFFIKQTRQTAKSAVVEKGEKKDMRSEIHLVHAGVNAGKKWIRKSGFTLCFRGGYGIGYTDIVIDAPEVDKDVLDILKPFMYLTSGIDLELTAGWSF